MSPCYRLTEKVPAFHRVLGHFPGVITYAHLLPLLEDLDALEQRYPQGLHRSVDWHAVEAVALTTAEIQALSTQRWQVYRGPVVRSAMYAPALLTYGLMRM